MKNRLIRFGKGPAKGHERERVMHPLLPGFLALVSGREMSKIY